MENGQDYLFCMELLSIRWREALDAIYQFLFLFFQIKLPGYQHISILPFLSKKSKAKTSSEQLLTWDCEVVANLNSSKSE